MRTDRKIRAAGRIRKLFFRRIPSLSPVPVLVLSLVLCYPSGLSAQQKAKRGSEESLFLDMRKIELGTLSGLEEKRHYLATIQLEKQRIQARMLRGVYENAFELYKSGNFENTRELTSRILSIDPGFSDASLLLQASNQLQGSARPVVSERLMIEDRFRDGLSLYQQGRLVESARRLEEVLKLAPGNLKARYWLNKVNEEISEDHYRRGQEAYSRLRLKEALDQWYAALLLKPNDPRLVSLISSAENELREEEANQALQNALDLYGRGRLVEAYEGLRKVLTIQPGDPKTVKIMAEVRSEIAGKHIAEGKKFYGMRRYDAAIGQWKKAREYASDPGYCDQLTGRAREQMKREEEDKKHRADEDARQNAAEASALDREREAALRRQRRENREKPAAALPVSTAVTEESRRAAQSHYLEGLKHFQNANLEKARDEWSIARQFDPGNPDVEAGLKRIDQMLGGQ
ncbi:MAG: hypothetical protein ABIG11_07835 [bacterium]